MSGMVNVSGAGPMMAGHGSPYGYRSPNPHIIQRGGGGGHAMMHHGMMPGGPHMTSPMHPHHQMPNHSPVSNPLIQQHSQTQSHQPAGSQSQQQSVVPGAASGTAATEKEKEVTQVSSMPLPPTQYVDLYTDEAVARGMAPKPPPPITDHYSMFGNPFSAEDKIIQSLESQGIRRLYSNKDVDRKKELHKLNQSILVNFLDLLDILIRAPESPKREEKIEDINLLFIHMHHLVNEFRPHQARETLRVMLQVQMRKRIQIAERFQKYLDEVQETIEKALRSLPEQDEANGNDGRGHDHPMDHTSEKGSAINAFDPTDISIARSLEDSLME